MLMRLLTRIASGIVGIVTGLIVADALLTDVSFTPVGLVEAALVYWVIHIVVTIVAFRALVREPSITRLLVLPLVVSVASLAISTHFVSGMQIEGGSTYIWTALIVWICTAVAHLGGHRINHKRKLRKELDREQERSDSDS
ncbi:MAG: hypothetical protein ACKOA9_07555 [Actinomycetota bacterium]